MLSDTERRRLHQRVPAQLQEATVLSPVLDDEGMLRVQLDATGGVLACPWTDTGRLPVAGDAAAVMESDHGNFWAIGVWPNG